MIGGGIKTFLESSTIHGLSYISTTGRYERLFWILVVLSGFMGASLLIKESFDSWSESPVRTTIETLPISEIKFPKVTVCPPKNTFTDLNYDLMISKIKHKIFTEKMRDEIFRYALEVLDKGSFSQSNWTKLHEENRFYNWYHGYTRISSPNWYKSPYYNIPQIYLNYEITTKATSGVVTTPFFGEKYRPDMVERSLIYEVNVFPPKSVGDNKNITLHLKVEYVLMKGINGDSRDKVFLSGSNCYLDANQTTAYSNFTAPSYYYGKSITLTRHFRSLKDVEKIKSDLMPGFRFSWWYSGQEITTESKYKNEEMTKLFIRQTERTSLVLL